MDEGEPQTGGRGTGPLLLLILLLLAAVLVGWAYLRNPPSSPSPGATSTPDSTPATSQSEH